MTTYPRIERDRDHHFAGLFGTLIHDHYKPLYADENVCDILGIDSVDDILNLPSLLPLFFGLHPSDAEQRYHDILNGKTPSSIYTYRITKPSGAIAHILAAESLTYRQSTPVVQMTMIDITEKYNQYSQLEKTAYVDVLSGLTNRNGFDVILHQQSLKATQESSALSCLFIDLDDFKLINDCYGHQTGDAVIRQFADCCKHSIRKSDFIGRWGGEEFLILLPRTNEHFAKILAERLRWRISKLRIPTSEGMITLTISVGIRTQNNSDISLSQLLEDADLALSYAKRQGKNQVMTFSETASLTEEAFTISFMS
ncbi:GGDEF domain-containing protein [Photobacterium aphoticum]|uniref:GGDEF domain-containing protein n=1 Tax=Photobacterium aphoticum TaxID=754436 RepID=UPI00069F6A81|nr:GGDEF domain-containing protein [Photobacterium aphoticum]GHA33516.1 hypothetical protein GCM10007086_03510 [Photobacterium aphoticum]